MIDEIFRKLPAFEQLDGIIVGADTLAISKTIQTVIVSSMDCDQKIAYLSEFFGRIQNNVKVKKLALKKLELLKDLAHQEIERLQEEVDRLNGERNTLELTELNKRLEVWIIKLEHAYDQYNKAVAEKQNAEEELPTYEEKMRVIKLSLSSEEESLPSKQGELQSVEKDILRTEETLR